jgi:dTDP-4-dehydrorhamnose reductase
VVARQPAAVALGSAECDITDPDAVAAAVRAGDVVINCAAYTAVDRAESETDAAFAVNEVGPRTLARRCAEVGARLIHVSTDFVFDGTATAPYDVDDATAPVNVYGRSKLAGEAAVHTALPDARIVRTAWVYSGTATDFVATMLRKERDSGPVTVVDDRFGSPTYAGDLAAGLLELAGLPDAPGLLHAAGAGTASWFELARAVFAEVGGDPERVRPCRGADYPTVAARPDYSVLSGRAWRAAGLTPLPPWRDGLRRALASVPRIDKVADR